MVIKIDKPVRCKYKRFCAHISNHVKVNFLHKITRNAESCPCKNDSSQYWSEPLRNSTYSAQPKTQHVTENLIELPWNTRTVKSYSKATLHIWNIHQYSCQRQGDLSLWFLWASEALRPLPLWGCIINQLTCHGAVSGAWLSAAWDLSTNINIPSSMTTDNSLTPTKAFSSKKILKTQLKTNFTEKRENRGNQHKSSNIHSPPALTTES